MPSLSPHPTGAALIAAAVLSVATACAPSQAFAQSTPQSGAMSMHPNSIQPETTLTVSAEGSVMADPDIAFITTGVQSEAESAKAAMEENRAAMNAVFDVLGAVGIAERDMQTSNFQIYPQYDYIEVRENDRDVSRQELRGYVVSNQLTVRVRDLDSLGPTLDALVEAGGNTFSGLRFALDDDTEAMNTARTRAVETALARAELLATAAGYRVGRIVTMSESTYNRGPEPMMAMARMESADMSTTPIAAGEVGYTANVSIEFELVH